MIQDYELRNLILAVYFRDASEEQKQLANILLQAIMDGQLDTIKQLFASNPEIFPRDNTILLYVLKTNWRLEMTQFFHQVVGCSFNSLYFSPEVLCEEAAEKDRSDVLRYLHTQGCAWNYKTLVSAASFDHGFECLQYAHSNGCTWHPDVVLEAINNQNWYHAIWSIVNGCSYNPEQFFELMVNYENDRQEELNKEAGGEGEELFDALQIYESYAEGEHFLQNPSHYETLHSFFFDHVCKFNGKGEIPVCLYEYLEALVDDIDDGLEQVDHEKVI